MSAPSASGCCSAGVQKQLSTASSTPLALASSASAAMSTSSVSGLDGVSTNSSLVLGRIACSQPSRSDSSTKVVSIPSFASQVLNNIVVVPKMLREDTI